MTTELCREDPYLRECEAVVTAVHPDAVVTDRSVFYPVGGGQPGDTGRIHGADGRVVEVVDTRKDRETGELLHQVRDGGVPLSVGESVRLEIDWERRYRLMRMHSCMHLLCSVITAPVTGGQVSDGKARLDFDLAETVDKEAVTAALNALIASARERTFRWITDEELDRQPELVKTMSVKPPTGSGRIRLVEFEGIDLQPCGGTHVANTREIGRVRVDKVDKKGKHNRRVVVVFDPA